MMDKELAVRLHPKICGQQLHVQQDTSDMPFSSGVSTGMGAI